MIKDLELKEFELHKPEDIKIAIIQSQYHNKLNSNMTKYAKEVLLLNGLKETNIHIFFSPGTWEIPFLTKTVIGNNYYNAIITFGIIIKGETYHFEMIANEVARALMVLSVGNNIPIGFEVLAVNNIEQAKERASLNNHNKGIEASNAVLTALKVYKDIKEKKK